MFNDINKKPDWFTTKLKFSGKIDAFLITSMTPLNNSDNIPIKDFKILIYFTEDIDIDSLNKIGVITLTNKKQEFVPCDFVVLKNILSITPTNALIKKNGVYFLNITKEVLSLTGKNLQFEYNFKFIMETFVEMPLLVSSTYPINHAINCALLTYVRILFNQPVDTSTVTKDSFIVDNLKEGYRITFEDDDCAVFCLHRDDFPEDTDIHVTLTTAIKSKTGVALKEDYHFSFRTESLPFRVTEVKPADKATNIPLTVQPEIYFNEKYDKTSIKDTTVYLEYNSFEIIGVVPLDKAIDVIQNTQIQIICSEPYDKTTAVKENVMLLLDDNNVECDINKENSNAIVLIPTSFLKIEKRYFIKVTTGLKSASGTNLNVAFESYFNTVTGGITFHADDIGTQVSIDYVWCQKGEVHEG